MPTEKKPKYPTTDRFTAYASAKFNTTVLAEYCFHPKRKWRADYAFPEFKIMLEVEGGTWVRGRHITPQGFLADMEKYNAAASLGWLLLRCQPKELFGIPVAQLIERTIATVITGTKTTL